MRAEVSGWLYLIALDLVVLVVVLALVSGCAGDGSVARPGPGAVKLIPSGSSLDGGPVVPVVGFACTTRAFTS